jgi:hypothetical protein
MDKAVHPQAHYLDRELAGVFNQRFLGWGGHWGLIIPLALVFGRYMGLHVYLQALLDQMDGYAR